MELTKRQQIIVGIVIGLFIFGVSLIIYFTTIIVGIAIGLFILGVGIVIYFTTKKSTCTPNCTGKNCGDDDGCEGKCNDKCPGYRCEDNGCTKGPPCTDNDQNCYPDSNCGDGCSSSNYGYRCNNDKICTQGPPCTDNDQNCYPDSNCGGDKCYKGGIRFRKKNSPDKIYFDVDWSDFSLVKSTTKLFLIYYYDSPIYLNTSSISKFLDMSQSSFKFNDESPVKTSFPSNIESVEYLDKSDYYPDLLSTSDSTSYPNMSNSSTKTRKNQLIHGYPIKFICIFRPIFLRIYKLAEKEQSTVYYDLYLKQFYPLFYDVNNMDTSEAYLKLWSSGFYYGIDICTMQKGNFTFNDRSTITMTNVDRFEVISSEENPTPFIMYYADSCLLDNKKAEPSVFKQVSIIPNSKQMVNMKDESISFFSF